MVMTERGTILKALRIFNNLTQAELAGRLGVSVTTINNWENNRRGIPDGKFFRVVEHMGGEIRVVCHVNVGGMKVELPWGG